MRFHLTFFYHVSTVEERVFDQIIAYATFHAPSFLYSDRRAKLYLSYNCPLQAFIGLSLI